MAPEIALAEAAQVLRKKELAGYLSREEADAILSEVLSLPLELTGHRELAETSTAIARERNLSVHDSLFLALAETRHAGLITADEALRSHWRGRP